MAKKKKSTVNEELELDQAYFNLTGYDTKSPKKRGIGGVLIGAICLLVLMLAGCAIGIPFLLNDDSTPTALPTQPSTTEPVTENTEPQAVIDAGTTVLGLDMSDFTRDEAIDALETLFTSDMTVSLADTEYTLPASEAITSFDANGAVDVLLDDPRLFHITDWLVLNENSIRTKAEQWADQWRRSAVETTWTVTGDIPTLEPIGAEPECQTLLITKGTPSYDLDSELLYQAILQGYNSGVFSVETTVYVGTVETYDLTPVYDQYFTAPVDAVMDMDTFHVSGGTHGYEFDLENAQALLDAAAPGEVIEIPFYRTAPEITVQSLKSLLFRDVLGSSSTEHTNEYNRNTNLKLACQAINGVILYPGQQFSFNDALGERTTAKGYLPAGSYVAGATVDTVGGGICQVSSTLYYCCLQADLDITLRDCHMYAVSYLPLGIDATISWGSYDYRFRNNTNYPIRIDAWVSDGYVHIQLIGTDEKDYYVEMEYYVEEVYPYETVYREMTSDNPDGYEDGDVIVTPYTGYGVYTYRCKYDKETNELISRDYEDYSEYWSRDEVIVKIVD